MQGLISLESNADLGQILRIEHALDSSRVLGERGERSCSFVFNRK
jgi:hypothetical protein